jgi:hypothetical protein
MHMFHYDSESSFRSGRRSAGLLVESPSFYRRPDAAVGMPMPMVRDTQWCLLKRLSVCCGITVMCIDISNVLSIVRIFTVMCNRRRKMQESLWTTSPEGPRKKHCI